MAGLALALAETTFTILENLEPEACEVWQVLESTAKDFRRRRAISYTWQPNTEESEPYVGITNMTSRRESGRGPEGGWEVAGGRGGGMQRTTSLAGLRAGRKSAGWAQARSGWGRRAGSFMAAANHRRGADAVQCLDAVPGRGGRREGSCEQ